MWIYTEINWNSYESKVTLLTLLWNQQVKTVRTVPSSQMDIVICDNEKGMSLWIYIAIKRIEMWSRKKLKRFYSVKTLQ